MHIFGVIGWKNSGKTTLMEGLVKELTAQGLRVSTIKHAHHNVDIDQPGKDSYRHRKAGACQVLLASANRWALMQEHRGAAPPPLSELLCQLTPVDLVLIEGYKNADHPKIETALQQSDRPLLALDNPSITAVAAGYDVPNLNVPVMDINDIKTVANFVLHKTDLGK